MRDHGPKAGDSAAGVAAAREMYARVLRLWARDLLVLRARGLHEPGRRTARALWAAPAGGERMGGIAA